MNMIIVWIDFFRNFHRLLLFSNLLLLLGNLLILLLVWPLIIHLNLLWMYGPLLLTAVKYSNELAVILLNWWHTSRVCYTCCMHDATMVSAKYISHNMQYRLNVCSHMTHAPRRRKVCHYFLMTDSLYVALILSRHALLSCFWLHRALCVPACQIKIGFTTRAICGKRCSCEILAKT